MPNNIIKLVDATQLDIALIATADAIREKTGDSSQISWDTTSGFADAIDDISGFESADGVSFGTIPMISFSIGSASSVYQAIEGMTWAEWLVSEYNIDGYKISGNSAIVNATETRQIGHIHGGSGGANLNDYIIADALYTTERI